MMTILSIDTAVDLPLGEMQADCAAVVPQETLTAFGQAMAEQTAQNLALGEDLDLALRCIREVLNKEELSATPKTADPVLPPLPVQATKTLELGQELESAAQVVGQVSHLQNLLASQECLAYGAHALPLSRRQSFPASPSLPVSEREVVQVSQVTTSVVSKAPEQIVDGTPVVRDVPAQVVQEASVRSEPMPPLSVQATKTLELGQELELAAQVVNQVTVQVVSKAPEQVADQVTTPVVSMAPMQVANETPVVREVPVQVEQGASVRPEPMPPLSVQVTKTLELGQELESAAQVVNQVTVQVVPKAPEQVVDHVTTPVQVANETPVVRDVPTQVVDETPVVRESPIQAVDETPVVRDESVRVVQEAPVRQEPISPLPAQVTKTLELGQELESAAQVVDEVTTQVVSKTPEQVAGETPAVRDVPAQVVQEAPVQQEPISPLTEQVAKTLELGQELESAAQVVDEVTAQVASTTPMQVANETPVVRDVPAQVVDETPVVREVPVQVVQEAPVRSEPMPPLPTQVTKTQELGQELELAAQVVSATPVRVADEKPVVSKMSEVETEVTSDETPEVTAEALVAAGVTGRAPVREASEVASSSAPSVTPVDIVRQQAVESAPSAVLVQAAEAVADTLLVSPGLLRGQGEVIVRLRPDVLEGTEVKISVTGRQLEVVFQPQSVDMAVMIENCRTQIVNHLAAKIAAFNVSVDVRKKKA